MAPKRKSDGGGLGPHVRPLRGGRTDFDPPVLRAVCQWLVMLNQRYNDAAAAAAGRSDGISPGIREGIRKRYSVLADAAMVLLSDARAPWSRVSWHRAGAALDKLLSELFTAGDPSAEAFFGVPLSQHNRGT